MGTFVGEGAGGAVGSVGLLVGAAVGRLVMGASVGGETRGSIGFELVDPGGTGPSRKS